MKVEGKIIKVGLVVYEDEPWFTFKFNKEEHPYMYDLDAKSDSRKEENEYDDVDNAFDGDKRISVTWIYDIEEEEIVGDDVNAPMLPMDAKPNDDTTAFVDTNEIKSLGMPTYHPPAT